MSILLRHPDVPVEDHVAVALRRVGDALMAAGQPPVNVRVSIQYDHNAAETVTKVARLLTMPAAALRQVGDGWHMDSHHADGLLNLHVFCGVTEPDEAKRERLTRELAELDERVRANGGGGHA